MRRLNRRVLWRKVQCHGPNRTYVCVVWGRACRSSRGAYAVWAASSRSRRLGGTRWRGTPSSSGGASMASWGCSLPRDAGSVSSRGGSSRDSVGCRSWRTCSSDARARVVEDVILGVYANDATLGDDATESKDNEDVASQLAKRDVDRAGVGVVNTKAKSRRYSLPRTSSTQATRTARNVNVLIHRASNTRMSATATNA